MFDKQTTEEKIFKKKISFKTILKMSSRFSSFIEKWIALKTEISN